jgi:hypothetical protein
MRFCRPLPRQAGKTPLLARYTVSTQLEDLVSKQKAATCFPSRPSHHQPLSGKYGSSSGKQVRCNFVITSRSLSLKEGNLLNNIILTPEGENHDY